MLCLVTAWASTYDPLPDGEFRVHHSQFDRVRTVATREPSDAQSQLCKFEIRVDTDGVPDPENVRFLNPDECTPTNAERARNALVQWRFVPLWVENRYVPAWTQLRLRVGEAPMEEVELPIEERVCRLSFG